MFVPTALIIDVQDVVFRVNHLCHCIQKIIASRLESRNTTILAHQMEWFADAAELSS